MVSGGARGFTGEEPGGVVRGMQRGSGESVWGYLMDMEVGAGMDGMRARWRSWLVCTRGRLEVGGDPD